MQFEKIRRINKSKIIVRSLIGLGVIGAISILPSFAKYRLTDSINIANGVVNYKVPDINIVGLYIKDEEEYIESNNIPTSGYILNIEKSVCKIYDGSTSIENAPIDTSITINYHDGVIGVDNISKRNIRCYLYFDNQKSLTVDNIIAGLNGKTTTPTFTNAATTDEGVYKVSDGMYGGYSYYWRGAATTNYVKFAGFCWRIVRINGDKTMRLIYDGTTCHANGTSTTESIAVASQTYNTSYDRSEYVGYTYTVGSQRGTSKESNLKTQTENWYKKYIAGTASDSAAGLKEKGYDAKVAAGKFCNDRETAMGYTWSSQPSSTFYYVGYDRSGAKSATSVTPTLNCSNADDVYNLKVGAITMDEVILAGGKEGSSGNIGNSNYYLYNGQSYWTMSPNGWKYNSSSDHYSNVFIVTSNGRITVHGAGISGSWGIRPVINLISGTQFKAGTTGTQSNPYEVL